MPLHYSLASLRQSTIPIGANVHGRPPASAVPTCLAKECLSATFLNFCVVRAKHLAQIVGTALDWPKRASERFREIAVIKSRTNRFIWPAAVEQVKSRFVRLKTKDDLLKQVGTALGSPRQAIR